MDTTSILFDTIELKLIRNDDKKSKHITKCYKMLYNPIHPAETCLASLISQPTKLLVVPPPRVEAGPGPQTKKIKHALLR